MENARTQGRSIFSDGVELKKVQRHFRPSSETRRREGG